MSRLLINLCPKIKSLISSAAGSMIDVKSVNLINGTRNFSITSRLLSGYPQVQKRAPDFTGTAVIDGDFKEIKLSDYRGKYLVLFFYPLDFALAIAEASKESYPDDDSLSGSMLSLAHSNSSTFFPPNTL